MKKYLIIIGLLFSGLFSINIYAETDFVDTETPVIEQQEDKIIDENMPVIQQSTGTLTASERGKYNKVTKVSNSNGGVIERNFYLNDLLVEKRIYSGSTSSVTCNMKQKISYYNDGSTVHTRRDYYYGRPGCTNQVSIRYNENSKIILTTTFQIGAPRISSITYKDSDGIYTISVAKFSGLANSYNGQVS